jgi:linoleoyl-CoA desaturase
MYLKTAIVFAWFVTSYVLLVFFVGTWWLALPLVISLGLSMAAVGFNIQHDGGHGAYSDRSWINKLMALTLDLLGGSSYMWARKHNSIHHSYANITGHDDDIDLGFFGRLSPHQKRL